MHSMAIKLRVFAALWPIRCCTKSKLSALVKKARAALQAKLVQSALPAMAAT